MRRLAPRWRDDRGFSLSELVFVIAILGLLVAIAIASYVMSVRFTDRTLCENNQRQLTRSAVLYSTDHDGAMPNALEDLRPYVRNFDAATACPGDGRTLEYDTTEDIVFCTYPGH